MKLFMHEKVFSFLYSLQFCILAFDYIESNTPNIKILSKHVSNIGNYPQPFNYPKSVIRNTWLDIQLSFWFKSVLHIKKPIYITHTCFVDTNIETAITKIITY